MSPEELLNSNAKFWNHQLTPTSIKPKNLEITHSLWFPILLKNQKETQEYWNKQYIIAAQKHPAPGQVHQTSDAENWYMALFTAK